MSHIPTHQRTTAGYCVNSARTAKDCDVTAHANPTFAWADLATERERQLTTGKRAERAKRDFRCQFAALSFDLRALSSTDVPVLLLNQPRVVFAKGFVVMTSRSFTLFTRWHLSSKLSSSSISKSSHSSCIPTI